MLENQPTVRSFQTDTRVGIARAVKGSLSAIKGTISGKALLALPLPRPSFPLVNATGVRKHGVKWVSDVFLDVEWRMTRGVTASDG